MGHARVRPTRIAGGIGAAAVVVAAAVAPAGAIWTLPSTAPFANADGQQNGCTATALPMDVVGAGGGRHIEMYLQTTCPASADVHWMSFRGSLVEVMPDGTRRTEIEPGLIARVQDTGDMTEPSRAGWLPQCSDPAYRGTHQWLLKGTLKTRRGPKDTAAYTAKVHRLQTVTC